MDIIHTLNTCEAFSKNKQIHILKVLKFSMLLTFKVVSIKVQILEAPFNNDRKEYAEA